MKDKKKTIQIAIAGFAFFLVVYFVMTFNRLTVKYQKLSNQAVEVERQYEALRATHAYLETQIALATSDEAVREWAYEDAHLIQEGDIPVVPLSAENVTPTPIANTSQVPAKTVKPWQVWWELFFGKQLP